METGFKAKKMTKAERAEVDRMIEELCKVSRRCQMESIKMQREAEISAAQIVLNC